MFSPRSHRRSSIRRIVQEAFSPFSTDSKTNKTGFQNTAIRPLEGATVGTFGASSSETVSGTAPAMGFSQFGSTLRKLPIDGKRFLKTEKTMNLTENSVHGIGVFLNPHRNRPDDRNDDVIEIRVLASPVFHSDFVNFCCNLQHDPENCPETLPAAAFVRFGGRLRGKI